MNIVVHLPSSDEGKQNLMKRVAELHAQSTLEQVHKLNCSRDERQKLLAKIIEDVQRSIIA